MKCWKELLFYKPHIELFRDGADHTAYGIRLVHISPFKKEIDKFKYARRAQNINETSIYIPVKRMKEIIEEAKYFIR